MLLQCSWHYKEVEESMWLRILSFLHFTYTESAFRLRVHWHITESQKHIRLLREQAHNNNNNEKNLCGRTELGNQNYCKPRVKTISVVASGVEVEGMLKAGLQQYQD